MFLAAIGLEDLPKQLSPAMHAKPTWFLCLCSLVTTTLLGAVFDSSPRRYLTLEEQGTFGAVNKIDCRIKNGGHNQATSP